ncbi:S8 family peptidase [Glycomyces xiaoerkulensis]|uniref:S8 family peptidase n=1 Tax=Glycomyces xiaoerkulensis TaxID=2038139 RepID=UPI00130014CF|nr:S8 family serine peptidase [Glycomyces xiaoerkulensis]
MRILPRFPLYTAVVAAATCTLLLPAAPASAEFEIERLEEDKEIPCEKPPDSREDLTAKAWTVDFLALNEAHQYNRGTYEDGTPVTIAVVDSGVNAELEVFEDRVVDGFDLWDPDAAGKCDAHTHGTSVAGAAAGRAQGRQFVGVAPEAEIMPLRIYQDTEDAGDGERSELLAQTIVAAVDNGADVINVSSVVLDTPELQGAVEYAHSQNVVIVAATGNNNLYMDDDGVPRKDRAYYPANYPEVIAVGAHNPDGFWYEKTNYGRNLDLLAPGAQVTMPYAGGGWHTDSGTSYAAPHVAGVAALLKGEFGDEIATPAWIERRIKQTAIHPANDFNVYQGHGVLDIPRALTAPPEVGAAPLPDEADPSESTPSFEPQSIDSIAVDYDPLRTEKIIAWSSVIGSITLIILVLVLKKLIPQGRRRRWKPGRRGGDNLPAARAD